MSTSRRLLLALLAGAGLLLLVPAPALAQGLLDCKEAPAAEVPGRGMTAFFERPRSGLPPQDDPFAPDATTTIVDQYHYAGLRFNTYDLGCGPDVSRSPEAVVGTAMANWLFTVPKFLVAATSAITEAAFAPDFLGVFDPLIVNVSTTLHDRVFLAWMPLTVAGIGFWLVLRARRASLASATAALAWGLLVLAATTALFRWPVEAGSLADDSVTATLSAVSAGLSDTEAGQTPGGQAAGNVHEALLYQAWLAGTFGSANSDTAQRYGPELFDAQALTWREAATLKDDPDAGQRILEAKAAQYERVAAAIKQADPDAYEHFNGKRSDDRLGYALLATLAALCALPFLLVASLMVLGSFLVLRLAVMLFPAFAVIGLFPAARGVVMGVFRTVAAAVINAIVFGIGAAITVRGIGIILDPRSGLPGWLAAVLMLILSGVLWAATKPFRRLTHMVNARTADPFGDAATAPGNTTRRLGRRAWRATSTGLAAITGGATAGATAELIRDDDEQEPRVESVPDRAEAHRDPIEPTAVTAPQASRSRPEAGPSPPAVGEDAEGPGPAGQPHDRAPDEARAVAPERAAAQSHPAAPAQLDPPPAAAASPPPRVTGDTYVPAGNAAADNVPVESEPEWIDGEEVYVIYRPDDQRVPRDA